MVSPEENLEKLKKTFEQAIKDQSARVTEWTNDVDEQQRRLSEAQIEKLKAADGQRSLFKNKADVDKLIDAIQMAMTEVNITSGISAAINVVEHYATYLQEPDVAKITQITQLCSESLSSLAEEIQANRTKIGAGERVVSALQGLGCAIAGFFLTILYLPAALVVLSPSSSNPSIILDYHKRVKGTFECSFTCFKKTWHGEKEPQELKELSLKLEELSKTISQTNGVSVNPNSLFAADNREETTVQRGLPSIKSQGHSS